MYMKVEISIPHPWHRLGMMERAVLILAVLLGSSHYELDSWVLRI